MSTLLKATRAASDDLLRQALHRSRLLSLDGLRERAFARAFRNLVYAQIWEDPVVDMQALEIHPDCHVVAIASGGCNVMSYLTAKPARITAIDLNGAHVALLRLKLAAARHLDSHHAFYELFGHANQRRNVHVYDTFLRPRLDAMTRTYWDSRDVFGRRRIEMLARGLYRHGLLGRFIASMHALARLLGADPAQLLAARTRAEQRDIYQRTLAPLFRHRVVRALLSSPASLFGLGIPPVQYRALAGDRPGGIAEVVEERVARLACDFDLRDNYFAWQAFGRSYPPAGEGVLPPYLQAENFEQIRTEAWRVNVWLSALGDYLARLPARSVDRFALLDAQDWMSDAELTGLWLEITRTARPGARVIFRTAAADSVLPGRIPSEILQRWEYAAERSAELHAADRSAIYGGLHLYTLRDAAA